MCLEIHLPELYDDNTLVIDKSLNFFYGKNGTGKSTLTNLIAKNGDQDNLAVLTFQGFESVLGENELLNAVVIGEHNKEIEVQIKNKQNKKNELETELTEIEKNFDVTFEGSTAYELKLHDLDISIGEKKKNRFLTDLARKITMIDNGLLVENARSYNRNNLISDIPNAKRLSESELEKYSNIINAKVSSKLKAIDIELFKSPEEILPRVNGLLVKYVKEKPVISVESELEESFLKSGLQLHSIGARCKFCGNIIDGKRYSDVKTYFDADEIKLIDVEVEKLKAKINQDIVELENINLNFDDIQKCFKEDFEHVKKQLMFEVRKAINGYQIFLNALDKKRPYEATACIELEESIGFKSYVDNLNDYIVKNNNLLDNLDENQKIAKENLRKHYIAIGLEEQEYKAIQDEIDKNQIKKSVLESRLTPLYNQVIEIKKQITDIESAITDLISQTLSTERLVVNINKKLDGLVDFTLVLQTNMTNNLEYYEIKNKAGEIRDISKLSTGEKNLIAFLYFIELLNSIEYRAKKKIIVFDDPMNSNDDTVQYFIMAELSRIIKLVKKDTNDDIFILLTHNIFFYSGLVYDLINDRSSENAYNLNNFFRLLKFDGRVSIQKVTKKGDDFTNTYDSLWHELALLYYLDKPRMMLNPIRRIIESFVIFNGIEGFYKDDGEAKRLFNVNSHGSVECEVDLVGKDKEYIINKMKTLFVNNNYGCHFNKKWKYWKEHCDTSSLAH